MSTNIMWYLYSRISYKTFCSVVLLRSFTHSDLCILTSPKGESKYKQLVKILSDTNKLQKTRKNTPRYYTTKRLIILKYIFCISCYYTTFSPKLIKFYVSIWWRVFSVELHLLLKYMYNSQYTCNLCKSEFSTVKRPK